MKNNDRRHLHLLCDISDLSTLLIESESIKIFFQQTVELVARHLDADACSIYIFDDSSQRLVLEASMGLTPESMQIRIKIGEGLVGTTFERLKPLRVGYISDYQNHKIVNKSIKNPFNSFLAVLRTGFKTS